MKGGLNTGFDPGQGVKRRVGLLLGVGLGLLQYFSGPLSVRSDHFDEP